MSRYIDADAMKADLDTIHSGDVGFSVFKQVIKDYIDVQPTADVVEARHGHWIDVGADLDGAWYYRCSVCGSDAVDGYEYPLCPYCGARMDGEEQDDE